MRVVKMGGSLLPWASKIMPAFKAYEALLVPGGGLFADTVRRMSNEFNISQERAHVLAVLSMHQYGLILSDLSGITTITDLGDFQRQAILLPFDIISRSDIEESWDVASDTIAAYVAMMTGEKEFIKVTCVDGLILDGEVIKKISAGKLLNTNTCLDKSLPSHLLKWNMDCRVINGRRVNNIRKALEGESIGTLVTGGK
jgi:aspartokinase-like uncharacterized kinase